MLIHQAGYVHEYLRSKHIPLSLPLSLSLPLLPSLIYLPFFLPLSIFPRSVRYIVAQPSFLSTLAPVAPTTREPSVRTATPRVPPPRRDEEASLHQQQERPSRNGAALCPEFVPRRSSCSFTRGDKSRASLSPLRLTPRCTDLTCVFPFLLFPYEKTSLTSWKIIIIGRVYGRLLLPHFWDNKGTRGRFIRVGCRA